MDVAGIVSTLIDKELRGAFKTSQQAEQYDNESDIMDCKRSIIHIIIVEEKRNIFHDIADKI